MLSDSSCQFVSPYTVHLNSRTQGIPSSIKNIMKQRRCLLLVAFCFVATLCWTDAVSAQSGLSSRGGTSNAEDATTTITSKKWSSFFSVDPSKILSILVNRGGLLLPNSVEKELAALANVVNVDEASLNLVERALVVKNFTVSIPGSSRESLRVGSVYITWDSYTRPCVDIQVEEVDTLVEFTNLMLTRSNWNELEEAGFPPTMEEYYDQSAPSSTFVRIGSIQLTGNVTSEVRSRPLNRIIANVTFDLHAFDDLNVQIRSLSEENLAKTGRPGCTTDELYNLLSSYFIDKLRTFLSAAVKDVTVGSFSDEGSTTVREARKLFASASHALKSYAGDAGKKKGDSLEEKLASRLEKFGVPSSREKLSALRELSTSAARSIDARSLAGTQLKRLRAAYERSKDDGNALDSAALVYKTRSRSINEKECTDKDSNGDDASGKIDEVEEAIIIFPDW